MKLVRISHYKYGLTPIKFTATTVLFTSLILSHVIFSEQSHDSHFGLDEEVILEPAHDYEKTSVEHNSLQTAHDTTSTTSHVEPGQRQSAAVQNFDQNDPFAVTFEDYLKEASKSPANYISNGVKESHPEAATPEEANLIIEDEEDNRPTQKESLPKIDYIFPASHKQETLKTDNKHGSSDDLQNEIKLLFGWKQLLTNKCSKTCGRGFRLNHLSCVDLKYDVRVEEDLCLKSNKPKPSELSNEACNEIDCPPTTILVEFQECNPNMSQEGICRPNLFKRFQCTMIDKRGVLIYLDDNKCNSTTATHFSADSNDESRLTGENNNGVSNRAQIIEDDVTFEDLFENNEKNDILPNINVDSAIDSNLDGRPFKNHPQNEPFFDLGPWTECNGSACGQLGKRVRKVSCRLFLSRSSKLVELPDSSCHHLNVPDSQEPCYMDCHEKESMNGPKLRFNSSDIGDETVYDLEMTRFVWKKGGCTKCSADCLGGRRESIIECWDKETETAVDGTSCDPELKPATTLEACNDVPCQPEWKIEPFSKCTKSCGSAGIKTRSVACVQQVRSHNGLSYMIVSNNLCIQSNGSMPHRRETCNRFDCKPQWDVEPWSSCNRKCGYGIRNRTVICVQEFANKEGPTLNSLHKQFYESREDDLLEALAISAKNWHPGKATQVPSRECYEEYKTVPSLEEKCFNFCEGEPYLDADPAQVYQMTHEALRRKTVTLKIGGKAQILEGRNLKVRCRVLNRQNHENLVKKSSDQVEWRKDGVLIFTNGSTIADKQYSPDDNSIYGEDVFGEKNQYMADEPNTKKIVKQGSTNISKRRTLNVRSWTNYQNSYLSSQRKFSFVPQRGRFSLVKENTLRIKKLRADDSGVYTCKYGSLSESLDLKVTSHRDRLDLDEKFTNNLG